MEKAIIITAPSGAGKTTLVKKLLQKRKDLSFSVSACTREKREMEVAGKDYYFLSITAFKEKMEAGEFLEYEEVYENMFYGTLESEVKRIWKTGKAVIFDIDVKGAVNLKEKLGDKALAIFIEPPSIEALVSRLTNRQSESQETINLRISKAEEELRYKEKMDTTVLNDILELAFEELECKVDEFIYSSGINSFKVSQTSEPS